MSWYPPEDNDDLFTPRKLQRATHKDKFWDYTLVGVFIVLAIIAVGIITQAAF